MKTHADDMSNRQLFEATAEILATITDSMVTRTDLENAITKAIEPLATKDDIKAIGDRLAGMEGRLAAKINNLRIVSA
jgi:hypothetical protein